jgi:hypothetical protein
MERGTGNGMSNERPADDQLAHIARGFRDYLAGQTGVELPAAERVSRTTLVEALALLDLALGQLADLTLVYGDDSRGVLDPLALPAAALVADYLRTALGAVWLTPDPHDPSGDQMLLLALPDRRTVDLLGTVRVALASSPLNLSETVVALIGTS